MAKKSQKSKIAELEAENKKLKAPKGIPSARVVKKVIKEVPDEVLLEREIRKYVKRSGGFKKDLPGDKMDRAKKLLGKAGRPYEKGVVPIWDDSIVVEGIPA